MDPTRNRLRISDPRAAVSITADPACARDIATAKQLHRRIAIRRADTAARLITELLPSAEQFTLAREEDQDGVWFVPVSIRDAAGQPLWFNADHFGDDQPPPAGHGQDAGAAPAATETLADVDEPTMEAICLLIEAAASWDPDTLDRTDGNAPDDQLSDMDLRVLYISAIQRAAARMNVSVNGDRLNSPQRGPMSM